MIRKGEMPLPNAILALDVAKYPKITENDITYYFCDESFSTYQYVLTYNGTDITLCMITNNDEQADDYLVHNNQTILLKAIG